ncbi:MAG: methyl-accepting chemotaxis protein [Azoarcus sp.]|nr:methyl-accepting chemotaxis protein [Azoarcus sp.]
MHELHGLLQSIQIKLHGIDHNVEALTEGIRQVAADQNNLFSISAEIEAVRAKRDGFSVITGEVLSLLKQTSQLTASIRNMSNQLRTDVTEVVAELEHVVRRVAPNQIDVPMDAAMPNVPSTGIEPVSGA